MAPPWSRGPLVFAAAIPGLLILAEAVAWCLGHPALPLLESWTGPWCHHDPSRTLRVADRLLPVCARCTGLYGGLVAGPLLGLLLPSRGRVLLPVLGAALLPVAVGLGAAIGEAAGWWSTANGTRLFLGLCLTVGPAALAVVGARILGEALTAP